MHPSAMKNAAAFFAAYAPHIAADGAPLTVEIGSQDVNGSIREVSPPHFRYTGVDFVSGKGVDIVLDDPYALPFADRSVDIVASSSCLEHSEMFWLTFLEVLRILKPGGLFYMNVPSNGSFHRYPVDCWRFYPDSARALVTWGRRNGYAPAVLESFISDQDGAIFSDYVAVFIRDEQHAAAFPNRILDHKTDFTNGQRLGSDDFLKPSELPEDLKRLRLILRVASGEMKLQGR